MLKSGLTGRTWKFMWTRKNYYPDPNLTMMGIHHVDQIHVEVFEDRVQLIFSRVIPNSLGSDIEQVGSTVEIDFDTWDKLVKHIRMERKSNGY